MWRELEIDRAINRVDDETKTYRFYGEIRAGRTWTKMFIPFVL
jgi:hypothetical protein